jgi:SanA protein
MRQKPGKKMFRLIIGGIISLNILWIIPRLITALYANHRIFGEADAPSQQVAIIFGAGLWRDGSPTPILKDRIRVGANLYFSGKVKKLLMSGDNQFVTYNEPEAMRQYALELGVSDEAIVLDFAGRRTYDSCYRAKHIFGVENAILVTQKFHMSRAIYTCNHLGLESVGVASDLRHYDRISELIWNIREIPATFIALIDLYIIHPLPVLGNPEFIFNPEVL